MKGAGRYAVLKDPQGAVFAILDPENARAETAGIPALGTFSWHELATTDSEAAVSFYSGLFGWDVMHRHDMGAYGIYIVFGSNGIQRGGIWNKPPEMPGPSNWLPYVHVPNADGSWKTAEASGARLLAGPMEVPGGSRITSFLDPTGAAFAIQSMPPTGEVLPVETSTPGRARPKSKTKPKTKAKAKVAAKSAAKPKSKPKLKSKAARKKVAKKPMKKAAKKKSRPLKKKAAKKVARKKSKSARRKK